MRSDKRTIIQVEGKKPKILKLFIVVFLMGKIGSFVF